MKYLLLLLLLGGCGQTVYKPVEINVPTSVECKIDKPEPPIYPTVTMDERTSLFDAVKAIITENELRKGYEAQLEAAVKSCQ